MQLTLVSHYGAKPPDFAAFLRQRQQQIAAALGNHFLPYTIEQVHGTIIGLEGAPMPDGVRSETFRQLRGEDRWFDFGALLDFLRQGFRGCEVQVGGFAGEEDHGFLSQGQAPFVRSFAIQREAVVAMGWPREREKTPQALDSLRRALQAFGALRKWAWREGEVDNDFYFVLGRLTAPVPEPERTELERAIREEMAAAVPLRWRVDAGTLQFVAYSDLRLPIETSRVFKVSDSATTAESLAQVYFCNR